jgi:hypothetical protein
VYESPLFLCRGGLEGIDGGVDGGALEEPERTTMVSTVPMSRAASLTVGPVALLRDGRKPL